MSVVVPPSFPPPSTSNYYAASHSSKIEIVEESTHKEPKRTYLTSADVIWYECLLCMTDIQSANSSTPWVHLWVSLIFSNWGGPVIVFAGYIQHPNWGHLTPGREPSLVLSFYSIAHSWLLFVGFTYGPQENATFPCHWWKCRSLSMWYFLFVLYQDSLATIFLFYFIYLVALGLSCGRQAPSLRHTGSLFVACKLLVAARGVFVATCGIFSCGIWDLVPWPGIEPGPPALRTWSLIHCTTREVPLATMFWLLDIF